MDLKRRSQIGVKHVVNEEERDAFFSHIVIP